MQGLEEEWKSVSVNGGSWNILSTGGYVIACDIPYGAYADHIVASHNAILYLHRGLMGEEPVPEPLPDRLPEVKMPPGMGHNI